MPLFLLAFLGFNGCTATNQTLKQKKNTFHEICFYPAALPKTATIHNLHEAANIFTEQNRENGAKIIDSFVINNNICFFMSRAKVLLPTHYHKKIAPETSYILSSTFSNSTRSRYTIRLGKKSIVKDTYSLDEKLPLLSPLSHGIRIIAPAKKILRFFRKLQTLSFVVQIGILPTGEVALQSNRSDTARSLLLLWKSNLFDLDTPVPGEYAIMASASKPAKESIRIFNPEWNLEVVPTGFRAEGAKLLFSTGTLNSAWDGEHTLRFLYALAYSHLQSPADALLFAPQVLGATPRVQVTLLSSEIFFPNISMLSSAETFYWMEGVKKEIEKYPPAFYANLLSLKMAKKIFTGNSQFLGGKGLQGPADSIDFTEMSRYFFRKDGLYGELFGTMKLYQYQGDILFESTMISEDVMKPFKAYFGKKERETKNVIVSLLVTGTESNTTIDAIEKMISTQPDIHIIQRLHEELSESVGWASISLSISPQKETEIVALYKKISEKEGKNRVYLGVYRVKKER
ncbi:hypothetical protein KAH37_05390 [bacterium]|nr:hypothetical protein [bacterium]